MIPDLDVVAFSFGISYSDILGHRGLTHSLGFALLPGSLALISASSLRTTRAAALLFVFVATASHGLLDMLTNGGLGIALWWPFSDERYFFPARPIEVSPIGIRPFLGRAGAAVLGSELVWVWLPCAAAGALVFRSAAAVVQDQRSGFDLKDTGFPLPRE